MRKQRINKHLFLSYSLANYLVNFVDPGEGGREGGKEGGREGVFNKVLHMKALPRGPNFKPFK